MVGRKASGQGLSHAGTPDKAVRHRCRTRHGDVIAPDDRKHWRYRTTPAIPPPQDRPTPCLRPPCPPRPCPRPVGPPPTSSTSEEHTSAPQSPMRHPSPALRFTKKTRTRTT